MSKNGVGVTCKKKGHTVTIVNTPANITTLRSLLPQTSTVRLVDLPFNPTDHGLPPGFESTDGLPFDLHPRFLQATETLRPAFESFISDTLSPNPPSSTLCIISDVLHCWTVETAADLNVFHSLFLVFSAYAAAVLTSVVWHLPRSDFAGGDEYYPLPNRPNIRLHQSQLPKFLLSPEKFRPLIDFHQRHITLTRRSGGFLVNTVQDLEREGVEFLKDWMGGIPVWTVGPILHHPVSESEHDCIGWLGNRPPNSVLYVSFGSMNTISSSQMMELAMGLEASEASFVWVVRPPVEFDYKGGFRAEEWLPEGFEERMRGKKRGILVRGWAPQMEILAHASTRAFLSQCGWNSVLEGLMNGLPMIGWPIEFEQFYSVKMLMEEKGVCVEIARGNNTAVDRVHVEKTIRSVMDGGEEGEEMRRKARELGKVLREAVGEGGPSVRAMDDFLKTALSPVSSSAKIN
ncbi:UDP-glycosyltransferase 92A1 [Acorus gramineus]|uniref:Glycosyltransferase n=1 Tax=Acorus gramineus TaxID=55184 RepID=A0AAV9ASY3_ACOGR|nr:UDP-glycosyltransferase 92A1 [Acorus gramineus]